MPRPVAVVGAAGFLGRALVEALRRSAREVSTYTRSVPFLGPDGAAAPGLVSARTVFWLATQINPQIAEQQPQKVAEDRAAFDAFLHAVRGLPAPPAVVLLSSGGTVYDPDTAPPYAETAPTRPLSAYGSAKLALESSLAAAALPRSVTLRVSNAYGPGQPVASGQGVIAHWLRAARRGEDIRLFGDPHTTRDYLFVDDIVAAMVAVDDCGGPLPPVLNVGSGHPTTLRKLAETVLTVVEDPALRLVVEPRRSFDVPRTWLDVSLADSVLDWRPSTPLVDGIAAAWSEVRRHGDPTA